MELLTKLLVAGGVMGLLDFVWLGCVARKLYYGEMGKMLLPRPNMLPAVLFYAIYITGVIVFVVDPALAKDSLVYATRYGALFGFVAYATYDLTGLSVVKGFTTKIVVIDILWGSILTMIVSTGTFLTINRWFS